MATTNYNDLTADEKLSLEDLAKQADYGQQGVAAAESAKTKAEAQRDACYAKLRASLSAIGRNPPAVITSVAVTLDATTNALSSFTIDHA